MDYSKKDRMNMSMGTKDYDKGYKAGDAKAKNERYLEKSLKGKVMGHASEVKHIKAVCYKDDMPKMKKDGYAKKGYSQEAYDYNY